jgi:hypothetical protein
MIDRDQIARAVAGLSAMFQGDGAALQLTALDEQLGRSSSPSRSTRSNARTAYCRPTGSATSSTVRCAVTSQGCDGWCSQTRGRPGRPPGLPFRIPVP